MSDPTVCFAHVFFFSFSTPCALTARQIMLIATAIERRLWAAAETLATHTRDSVSGREPQFRSREWLPRPHLTESLWIPPEQGSTVLSLLDYLTCGDSAGQSCFSCLSDTSRPCFCQWLWTKRKAVEGLEERFVSIFLSRFCVLQNDVARTEWWTKNMLVPNIQYLQVLNRPAVVTVGISNANLDTSSCNWLL